MLFHENRKRVGKDLVLREGEDVQARRVTIDDDAERYWTRLSHENLGDE